MTHQQDGNLFSESTVSLRTNIHRSFTNKKDAVIYAANFLKRLDLDVISQLTIVTEQEVFEGYSVSIAITDSSDGTSETKLKKLNELLST